MNAEVHGLMAEFETAEGLLKAVRQVRASGYRHIEAYTPFAVEGLDEALNFREQRLPVIIALCGALGGAGALLGQYYLAVIDYPLNLGGRPLDSWPAFMLITFEFTVLGAALAAFVGMLAFNGLPRLYHPAFDAEGFGQASQDRFFLCIEARDPLFDAESTSRLLRGLGACCVKDVAT